MSRRRSLWFVPAAILAATTSFSLSSPLWIRIVGKSDIYRCLSLTRVLHRRCYTDRGQYTPVVHPERQIYSPLGV